MAVATARQNRSVQWHPSANFSPAPGGEDLGLEQTPNDRRPNSRASEQEWRSWDRLEVNIPQGFEPDSSYRQRAN